MLHHHHFTTTTTRWEIGLYTPPQVAPTGTGNSQPGAQDLVASSQVAATLLAKSASQTQSVAGTNQLRASGSSSSAVASGSASLSSGSAAATPQWWHQFPPNNYRTIISNSRTHILENASLVIRDVNRLDQGYYLCQAANNFGSLSSLIKLTVNGK